MSTIRRWTDGERLYESDGSECEVVRKLRADAVVGTHLDALVEALREIVGIDALHRPTLGAMCTVAIDMGEIAEAALASLTDEPGGTNG
jgi:hypothetical protein